MTKRKRTVKRLPRNRRRINPHDPPRVQLAVMLPEPLAHGIIAIAAMENWSISRVIAEALHDYFQGRFKR